MENTLLVDDVLDNPVWAALTGPHASFAEVNGQAARYRSDVTVFAALADQTDPAAWHDFAELLGPGGTAVMPFLRAPLPAGWALLTALPGVQMAGPRAQPGADAGAGIVMLGADDVPEMLDLTARTRPGPFLPRTREMGTYLGVRRGGRLVAMAGERLRPTGWTEISAVCTDPAHRGQGLGGRLVTAVVAGVLARRELPFLHTTAANTGAIRLYESLGFTRRASMTFAVVQAPADPPCPPSWPPGWVAL